MIAHAGCILDRIGNPANDVRGKLPADLINPIFAYSLNRKLRKLYDGNWFRYRQADGVERNYPQNEPNFSLGDVHLVKLFDQKKKFDFAEKAMVQLDESKQPKLVKQDGLFRAVFSGSEYLEKDSGRFSLEKIQDEFYITFVGKGDYPRPGFGLWGPDQSVTIEPSTEAIGKFTVNRNRGGMKRHQQSNVYGCFYGYDANQNNNRVMSVNEEGHNVKSETIDNIENIGIGRSEQRYYIGEVLEVVMHLEDLKQKWGDLLTIKTIEFYGNYQ